LLSGRSTFDGRELGDGEPEGCELDGSGGAASSPDGSGSLRVDAVAPVSTVVEAAQEGPEGNRATAMAVVAAAAHLVLALRLI
jgi:hypothetical protein